MKRDLLKNTLVTITLSLILIISSDKSLANQPQKLGVFSDWEVFKDKAPNDCWAATIPTEGSYNRSRNGQRLLMVFSRPSANTEGQVGVTVGYKVNAPSHVEISAHNVTIRLIITKDWAFPKNSEADARLVKAFMKGEEAVVKVMNGTKVLDWYKFSLRGFTAAFGTSIASCRQ